MIISVQGFLLGMQEISIVIAEALKYFDWSFQLLLWNFDIQQQLHDHSTVSALL